MENQVFIITSLFSCFSVLGLLKLMQLVCLAMEWLHVCSLKHTQIQTGLKKGQTAQTKLRRL